MAKADDVPANSVLPIPLPQMVVDDLPGVRKEAALRIKRLIDFLMTSPRLALSTAV